jgi:hypothetical protein
MPGPRRKTTAAQDAEFLAKVLAIRKEWMSDPNADLPAIIRKHLKMPEPDPDQGEEIS